MKIKYPVSLLLGCLLLFRFVTVTMEIGFQSTYAQVSALISLIILFIVLWVETGRVEKAEEESEEDYDPAATEIIETDPYHEKVAMPQQ